MQKLIKPNSVFLTDMLQSDILSKKIKNIKTTVLKARKKKVPLTYIFLCICNVGSDFGQSMQLQSELLKVKQKEEKVPTSIQFAYCTE